MSRPDQPERSSRLSGTVQDSVAASIRRIAEWPDVNAVQYVDVEGAMAQAASLDDNHLVGTSGKLLQGLTILLKDVIDAKGMPSTDGSPVSRHPDQDAAVVRRIRAAGGVVLGKANLDQYALGATGINPHLGRCANPWDLLRVPGGSSSGSAAAVASGLATVALGTDTGGSVRTPSALCGVVGLRPSLGVVPTDGVFPVSPFFDTVGPIGRTATDVLKLFMAIAGPRSVSSLASIGGREWTNVHESIDGLRVGIPQGHFLDSTSADVADVVDPSFKVLEALGAELVEVHLSESDLAQEMMSVMMLADAYAHHHHRMVERREIYDDDLFERILRGSAVDGKQYSSARSWGANWRSRVLGLFGDVHVLALPTVPVIAPLAADCIDTVDATMRLTQFTFAWSLAEVPAMSVPCGFANGLPVGLQLIAPPLREDMLFRVALAYQGVTHWHREQPSYPRPSNARTSSHVTT